MSRLTNGILWSDMRVTQQAKAETRKRILAAAKSLFASNGFSETATRDISIEAGVAAGTLFNYFPTKEAIVLCLASEAVDGATANFWKRRHDEATLEEDIFSLVATFLRKLKPYRKYLQPTIETALHPTRSRQDSIRSAYFEALHEILRHHEIKDGLSTAHAQMHWSLVVGVLAFWTGDRSPKQEDTLAMLDESIHMFLDWYYSQ